MGQPGYQPGHQRHPTAPQRPVTATVPVGTTPVSPSSEHSTFALITVSAKGEVFLRLGGRPTFFLDTHMTTTSIISTIAPESERMAVVDRLFGLSYVLKLEPTVFTMAEHLSSQYNGGYWQFHTLSNGGFYAAPRLVTIFDVSCDNGFEGTLSADALGIAACLYAYSHLSFGDGAFAETCATQYHLLREYMFEHAEVRAILAATD